MTAAGPLRRILTDPAPRLREGRGSVLGPDTARRARWWELRLDCGHTVERSVRYRPRGGRLARRALSEVLPPPKRARCHLCPPL